MMKNFTFHLIYTASFLQMIASFLTKIKIHGTNFNGRRLLKSIKKAKTYDHLEIERKWQKYWDDSQTFLCKRRPGHPKKYVLDMFPYPSGNIFRLTIGDFTTIRVVYY